MFLIAMIELYSSFNKWNQHLLNGDKQSPLGLESDMAKQPGGKCPGMLLRPAACGLQDYKSFIPLKSNGVCHNDIN